MSKKLGSRLVSFVLVAAAVLMGSIMVAADAHAGTTIDVGGVKVSYTKYGLDAYYDATDGTLTVAVLEPGGNLTVTVTANAYNSWDYVDLFLYSAYAVNSVTVKGYYNARADVLIPVYLVGQLNQVKTFTLVNGVSGLTDSYSTYGVGSVYFPAKITMTNAAAAYNLLGMDYSSIFAASAAESKAALKNKIAAADAVQALSQKQDYLERLQKQLLENSANQN